MADLSDFLPHVLPWVSGCPDPVAEAQIRNAMAEFCAYTKVWRHVVRGLPATTSQRIVIPVPPGVVVHDIEGAWLDGRPLAPVPYHDLDSHDLDDLGGVPQGFTQVRPGEIALVPRGTGTLRLSLILKPSLHPRGKNTIAYSVFSPDVFDGTYEEDQVPVPGTFVVPDFIMEQHGQAIGDGALARIKMMPRQPWSDVQQAAIHRAAFEAAMKASWSRNLTGQQRAPRRTRPQYF